MAAVPLAGVVAAVSFGAQSADAAPSAVTVTGGSVLSHRSSSQTGALG
ncbi:hypothetical protein [Actinospica sp.]|nr:hypothetical protein [Actinospica sp.]HWG26616.1 hypothetical protein [Actinospica sp.]